MKKLIALSILVTLFQFAFAQQNVFEKAKIEFGKNNLKGANKLIDKCLLDAETKKNPNVALLKSQIMFGIFKNPGMSEKFPGALKDALKYADKAIDLNGEESVKVAFRQENKAYFDLIIKQNNKEGLDAYNSEKYPKALPIFKRSLTFGLDTQALVLVGECYWKMNLKIESLPYFKQAAQIIYEAVSDSNSKVYGYHKIPFRQLGQYYMDKKQYDTAYVIVKNGRAILPNDPVLSSYTYNLMRFALEKIPPSEDYLRMVQQSLKDFPSDSFLNHRENSIYIFLLNGMAKANEQKQFDSFVMVYAKSKTEKGKSKNIALIKKFDIFAGQNEVDFIDKLKYYFAEINLREACFATFMTQYNRALILSDSRDPLTEMVKAEQNPLIAEIVFSRYLVLNPKNAPLMKLRAEYSAAKNKSNPGYYDLLPMLLLNDASAKDFPKDLTFKAKAKEYRIRLIKEATDSSDFVLARRIWQESNTMYPDLKKSLEAQWKEIVIKDFKVNYFGSRINPPGKKEEGIPEFRWKGNVDQCLPGKMSDTLLLRLERRINYFRRMAGLTEEIVLNNDNNENCEMAALMCEANKSMSHEPNDGWRCFIPAGFDALKRSVLSKDGNPAIAIMAAMGQNHATVGNRRWLLYPYAQLMGIGTSNSYTSILTIDNSNKTDTLKYKSQAIMWPPANYCPKMMVYKKWSFTINQNLKGAIVTMKNAKGENVALKQDALADGYGINTLVWEPEIVAQTLADNDEFTVSVKLGNGKMFTYKVIVADVKL